MNLSPISSQAIQNQRLPDNLELQVAILKTQQNVDRQQGEAVLKLLNAATVEPGRIDVYV